MEEKKIPLSEKNIYDFIKENDFVSFAEFLRNFNNSKGDYELKLKENPNIIFFSGISKKLFTILYSLQTKNKIYFKPCHFLIYLADGHLLKLPLAKRFNLKKPHWFPIIYRTIDKMPSETKNFQKIYYHNKEVKKDGEKKETNI